MINAEQLHGSKFMTSKTTLNEYEKQFWSQGLELIGLDEAGRGPLAGPLVVAGVVFKKGYQNEKIYDSKALSEKKRKELFSIIIKEAKAFEFLIIEPSQIDEENIYRATQNAMNRIASKMEASIVLTDAMPLPNQKKETIAIIKGDQKSVSIAAASILAKVIRDARMKGYDFMYPEYGFVKHKGYPTKTHLAALEKYGILPIHRKSYGPVQRIDQMKFNFK